ncbi:MAG TPA: von Willebrand factor type A domain-containing protein [Chthoniobacter sp.]|jgi:Mg-chelatase subunit ChlD/tetratricopeptide (TPR) repeat protein
MTPKHSPTPEEKLEMQVTALLLGELSPAEAADLQARIAAEPALAVLHTRLSKALELLHEATAVPDQPAPAAPVQLSSERRERLLAYFKTAPSEPAPVSKPIPMASTRPTRDWSWLPPLGIAAAVVALFGFFAMPKFANAPNSQSRPNREMTVSIDRSEIEAPPLRSPSLQDMGSVSSKDENLKKLVDKYPTFTVASTVPLVVSPAGAAVPPSVSQTITSDGGKIASNSPTTIVLPNLNSDVTPPVSFWDTNTPATGGGGGLALCQLLQFEFQRYPGHPATNSLAPVLRDLLGKSSVSGSNQTGANFTSTQLYGFVPRYSTTDMTKQPGSTYGSTLRQIVDNSATGAGATDGKQLQPKQERLYNSPDELLFGAQAGVTNSSPNPASAGYERIVNDYYIQPPLNTGAGPSTAAVGGAISFSGGSLGINSTINGTLTPGPESSPMIVGQAVSGVEIPAGTTIFGFNDNINLAQTDRQSDFVFRPVLDMDSERRISDLNHQSQAIGSLGGVNTYSGGTTISGGTLEIGGTAGQIAGAGAMTKIGAGTLTLGTGSVSNSSASSNAPTANIYFGGSSVLKQVPQAPVVASSINGTSVQGDDGKDLNGLNITGNLRPKDKVVPREFVFAPSLAMRDPDKDGFANEDLWFQNPSQTLNLTSGRVMQAGGTINGNVGRSTVTVQSPNGTGTLDTGTLIANNNASTSFAGTISGQLNSTAQAPVVTPRYPPEIQQNNLKELSFDALLGQAHTPGTQDDTRRVIGDGSSKATSSTGKSTTRNQAAPANVFYGGGTAGVSAANPVFTGEGFFYEEPAKSGYQVQLQRDHTDNSPDEPRFGAQAGGVSNGSTAPIMNAAGEPVRSEEEKEEVVETMVESAKTPQAAIAAGKAAMKDRNYEKATAYFKRASDLSPQTGKKSSLHKEAVDQFSTASVDLANELITEGRYQEAQDTLSTSLGDNYDPHNKKAVTLLSHLEQPDYFNKNITPKFRGNVEQVKQWFLEAQGLYDTGRLDLAKQRCEHILNVDPYNRAAREFEEKIERARDDYGIATYNQTRAKQVADVDNAWAMPVRKFIVRESSFENFGVFSPDTEELKRKLETIIIPKIDFRDTTLREAIDWLKKKSVELDASSPAGSKGTNIVLKLPEVASGEGKDKEASNPADVRITTSLNNVPMIEALKYVTGLANLKFKVEPHAVSVVPLTEPTDVLVTGAWEVPPGLIPPTSETGITNSKDAETKAREAVKNWLISNGVQLNGAAGAIYNPKTGRLFVRDTQDQLDLVDQIIKNESAAKAKPKPETPAKPQPPSALIPQPEIQTQDNAFSTFSLNVSDVSFKLAAASLEQGHMPDPSTVRSEEFINAFDYRDPEPVPGAPLAFVAERAHDPFAQNRDLLRFSVKTAAAGRQPGRPLNIVLLLDKSGSMERADRVNIVREALRVLTAQLQPTDTLSIVTFARTPHLWADGVAGDKAGDLVAKVSEITPEGGTNLEAALDLGYETAQRHFAVTSINRVVLFTDGAANLGDVDPDALTKKVEAKRKQGVALDCFGIGWEGYNDDLLEQLTRNGDGRYGFINTPEDAKENFATQIAGALQVAASDVKVQVEFNPRRVTAYRQIGYAKHQLTKEQFRDNSVAAAQIGAAESGNALYVVAVDPKGEGDVATVRVRYRVPGTADYREHEWIVSYQSNTPSLEQASPALRLAGTAAAFSEMLAANPYAGDVTSDRLLSLLDGVPAIYGADPRPQKLEWMIRQARSLGGR